MSSQLNSEVSGPKHMSSTQNRWALLPEPLPRKLVNLEGLVDAADEIALTLEAAQKPRELGRELENTRPFTHRIMHRKVINERLLASARDEVRMLLVELDQPTRNEICADKALRNKLKNIIAASATEIAEWEGKKLGWFSGWS